MPGPRAKLPGRGARPPRPTPPPSSSVGSITGGKGVRKTEKQTRRPTPISQLVPKSGKAVKLSPRDIRRLSPTLDELDRQVQTFDVPKVRTTSSLRSVEGGESIEREARQANKPRVNTAIRTLKKMGVPTPKARPLGTPGSSSVRSIEGGRAVTKESAQAGRVRRAASGPPASQPSARGRARGKPEAIREHQRQVAAERSERIYGRVGSQPTGRGRGRGGTPRTRARKEAVATVKAERVYGPTERRQLREIAARERRVFDAAKELLESHQGDNPLEAAGGLLGKKTGIRVPAWGGRHELTVGDFATAVPVGGVGLGIARRVAPAIAKRVAAKGSTGGAARTSPRLTPTERVKALGYRLDEIAAGTGGAAVTGAATRRGRVAQRAAQAERRVDKASQGQVNAPAAVTKGTKAVQGGQSVAGKIGGKLERTTSAAVNPAVLPIAATSPAIPLAEAPIQVGRVAIENPKTFAKNSAKSFKESLAGIPSALEQMVTDPEGAINAIIEDYSYRYGPLMEGDTAEFRRRALEGGLTPYAFDALVVGPPAGRVAGAAARRGALGSKAKGLATRERPAKRVSGGIVKEQVTGKNLGTAAAQAVLDWARGKRGEKAKRNKEAVQPGEGEVLSLRGKSRRVRGDLAVRKGRTYLSQVEHQARELGRKGATGEIARLQKGDQEKALKYAIQLGIRDPSTAKAVLIQRIEQIQAARKERDFDASGFDEIPVLERLIVNAEEIFTPELARVARSQRQRAKRTAAVDPAFRSEAQIARTYAQQGELLGMKRAEGESAKDFASRVRATAKKVGLDDPGYFPSQMKNRPLFSVFAPGGRKAIAGSKRYTGETFRLGIEDPSPRVLVEGLAKNIKRGYNWKLVADNAERHILGPKFREKSMRELVQELHREGIDPANVAFWNPGRFHAKRESLEARGDQPEFTADDLGVEGLDLSGVLVRSPDEFDKSTGWSVIPKDVADELENVTAGAGKASRAFGIAKGKQSRILLGAANLPWLQFQVAANAALTGLGGVSPADVPGAVRWWNGLTPEQKAAVEPFVGTGSSKFDTRQTKMGAAAQGDLVNAYRALKQSVGGKTIWRRADLQVADLNPLDVLFRADNAQNNAFRRLVLYSRVNRDAWSRMGENTNAIGRLQNRIQSYFRKAPDEQLRKVMEDPEAMETHAKATLDLLGDYTTFTAKERSVLANNVMFYGFLRFSLRFTFWTMPVHHPVVTGVIGNLARLESKERQELLGGDELPWGLGRIYDDKGRVVVDLARMNPAMNVLAQSSNLNQAFSVMPPMFVHLIEQAANKDFFTGKNFLVEGEAQPRKYLSIGIENRLRIALREGMNLFYPARVAEEIAQKGAPQGADSLFFDLRPTRYGEETTAKIKAEARRSGTDPFTLALRETLPFGGILDESLRGPAGEDARTAARIRESKKAEAEQLHPKRKKSDNAYSDVFEDVLGKKQNPYKELLKGITD